MAPSPGPYRRARGTQRLLGRKIRHRVAGCRPWDARGTIKGTVLGQGAGMAVTLQQFIENLVVSGLFSAAELSAYQESLPPEKRPKDAQTLARRLNQAGKITKFQAAAAYQGKTKGLVFDEYIVLDKIGSGGMGDVFKAKHRVMERIVALKVLPGKAMQSPESVERFRREVRAAARLTHPNIVTAYDARKHEDTHCLVMEYVDGDDLSNIAVEGEPLPVQQVVGWVVQAAKGLEYAHKRGIVHRDIKPANLLLDREGTIKILDMGLARIRPVAKAEDTGGADPLTATGQVMGTCDYMSPEQAEDPHSADHRADIYSLGCTLYRLLTGQKPYESKMLIKTLLAHREAPIPSLSEARPDVPQELDAVFQKMLAKEPGDRHQSMTEVIADLEACLESYRVPAGGSGGDSSTSRVVGSSPRGVSPGAPRKAAAASEETVAPHAEQETDKGIAEKPVPDARWMAFILAGIGSATVVVILALLVASIGGGDDESQNQPKVAEASDKDSTPSRGLVATTNEDETYLILRWSAPDRHDSQLLLDDEELDIEELVDPDNPERIQVPAESGSHKVSLSRRGYEPFEQEFEIVDGKDLMIQPVWRKFAGPVQPDKSRTTTQGAETEDQARSAREQPTAEPAATPEDMPTSQPTQQPARMADKSKPSALSEAERQLLDRFESKEQRYTEALEPVEELVAAWDFRGAMGVLEKVDFSEPDLVTRLAQRHEEVGRLAKLKTRIVDAINSAAPPLTKSDLWLRGSGGEVTGADEEAIAAETKAGKKETFAWGDLSAKTASEIMQLVVDDQSGDDWVTAGLFALVIDDSELAERRFGTARSHGVEIAPYRSSLAVTEFARAGQLLAQKAYTEAEAALASIGQDYGETPWFAANNLVFKAALQAAELGQGELASETGLAKPSTVTVTAKHRKTLKGHGNKVVDLAFFPRGMGLASCVSNGAEVFLWNADYRSKWVRELEGTRVAFSPDGTTLAVGGRDHAKGAHLVSYHMQLGSKLRDVVTRTEGIRSLAFSPDGKVLAMGGTDMTVTLVLANGNVGTLVGHTGTVESVAFSRDGKMLASGSSDQSIKLWDTKKGKEIHTLAGHTRRVGCVAFFPIGATLASSGTEGDDTVRIWDTKTGEQLRVVNTPGKLWAMAVSPDGKTIATADHVVDGKHAVILWDAQTGGEQLKLTDASETVGVVAFSPDGKTLAAGSGFSIDLWDIQTKQAAPAKTR